MGKKLCLIFLAPLKGFKIAMPIYRSAAKLAPNNRFFTKAERIKTLVNIVYEFLPGFDIFSVPAVLLVY